MYTDANFNWSVSALRPVTDVKTQLAYPRFVAILRSSGRSSSSRSALLFQIPR